MDYIDEYRRIEIEILSVDSIPCSLVGKHAIFSKNGSRISDSWEFPWPMDWIDDELSKVVVRNSNISQTLKLTITNSEEPDQTITFRLRSYIDLRIGDIHGIVSKHDPDAPALINSSGSRRYSYGSFSKNTKRLAGGLISIGVQRGDNTAVWAVNSPEYVISQFGITQAGSAMVPLNAYEKEHYIETMLNKSEASTLILQVGTKATENIEILYRICPELCESIPGKLHSKRIPNLRNVIVISDQEYAGTFRWSDIISFGTAISDEQIEARQTTLSIDDPAHIIFTSGTTGIPKGVVLSHGNMIENAYAHKQMMEIVPQDVVCLQAPMFHSFGCIASALTAVLSGCSLVMVDKFRSEITLSLIMREKCTVVSGVPVMFTGLARVLENTNQPPSEKLKIRTGVIAGAPTGVTLYNDLKNILKIKNPIIAYGLTEASPGVSKLYVNDNDGIIPGNAGKPLPGVRVKIVDIDKKTPITNANEKGEIIVSGYNIMQGYYNDPDETGKTIDDKGWLHTGDIGYIGNDGNLYVTDRFKDIIIRNGENISPREIEDMIDLHPEIVMTSVVGVKHPDCGEELFAFVTVKEDSNLTDRDIKKFLDGKIAKYKIPRFVKIIDAFPLSSTGKILKKVLREEAKQLTVF